MVAWPGGGEEVGGGRVCMASIWKTNGPDDVPMASTYDDDALERTHSSSIDGRRPTLTRLNVVVLKVLLVESIFRLRHGLGGSAASARSAEGG